MEENALKEMLSQKNAEFKQALEQHQKCEEELESLRSKRILTAEDERKIKDLKKRKLGLKDRMYAMMSEYRSSSR
jgi:uncharacterized protein YdcH (DUF465 family)